MRVIKSTDGPAGFTDDGWIFRIGLPPIMTRRTPRLNYIAVSSHNSGSIVQYYCPHTQQIHWYGLGTVTEHIYDIDKFMPRAFIPLITATTPFYIAHGTLYVYMRSFVWSFAKCRLLSKYPILRTSNSSIFDCDAPLTVYIGYSRLMISQGNNACTYDGANFRYDHMSITKYPSRLQVLYHDPYGICVAFDTITQTTVHVLYSRVQQIESGHKQYTIYGNNVFAISGDRLVKLDASSHPSIMPSDLKVKRRTIQLLPFP